MDLERRLARPGAEIAFADTGPGGPAVVLTHGAGLDHTMFDDQVAALTGRGHRVVVWDMRGHGASTLEPAARFTAPDALDDLGALLDACGLERPVLVGHSLGGNLVQAFVRSRPDRAAGHVVLDSTWNAGPLSAAGRLALAAAAPALAMIPARSLPRQMARVSAVVPDVVARLEEVFARMPKRTFLDVWRATASLVEPDPGYRAPVPLVLVRGARDRTGNIATAMPRWARAEGVRETVVPDAGHVVTWDAPDATSRVLLDALELRHR
ncbi:alpha/beta fold hydrolase [Pseudonocardia endophytica]|uniref:Pimeloyl-ACP methyl ester carboxylesterase n=1 Tax=Pseudonocardia endophytica TaxID=401976 RepID=A0A4R1HPB5_PSEEN|nr:alpha/beta hydrolase [Pseudonocardia endophytica]TCK22983.1 pimeloyl-ACP methyl ester carboxylesterase [Pseudonocardia endophytica]